MSTKKVWSRLFHSRKSLIVLCSIVAVFTISFGCGAWIISEEKDVTLSVNNNATKITTYAKTVADLLEEEEIDIADISDVSAELGSDLEDGQELKVEVTSDFKILVDGDTVKVSVAADDVAGVLDEAGVILGEHDTVEPGLTASACQDMVIDIHRVTIQEEIRETELAYSVETKKDNAIVSGEKVVEQAGKSGLQKDTYLITYRDGELYSEELINSEVTDPVTEIVVVGTGEKKAPVNDEKNSENEESTASDSTADGTSNENTAPNGMAYSRVLTCKATAYHESEGSLTKSGTLSRFGAIAVDPSVIPLGTKLYVEGYGYCVAEDTGGMIKGNRIDVYLNSESECENWGVRSVTVYILK